MTTDYKATGTYSDKDLNSKDLAKIKMAQQKYIGAQTQAERDVAHSEAEDVRRSASYVGNGTGYSGGADGSNFLQGTPRTPAPTDTGFKRINSSPNTQAMYDTAYSAQKALIDENYYNTINRLKGAYNANTMEYGLQRNDIKADYIDSIKSIGQQMYENLQRSKETSSARGIMNSSMGRAQDQGFVRSGSEYINTATTERDKMLNDLQTRITNLTQTYNNDLTTLEASKGAQLSFAQNNALNNKLNADMELYKFDTQVDWNQYAMDKGQENNVELAHLQNRFNVDLNKLNFEQQKVLTNLNTDAQARLAYVSQSGNIAMFNKKLEIEEYNAQIEFEIAQFASMYGTPSPQYEYYSNVQKNAMFGLANQVYSGKLTASEASRQMESVLKANSSTAVNVSSILNKLD